MKGLLSGLLIVGAVILVLGLMFTSGYNRLVAADEAVNSAWAQVQNVYQRRLDLIPNLVETVKGYAAHERQTLQGVVDARAKVTQIHLSQEMLNNPQLFDQFQKVQGELSGALSRLLVVAERYPDLKANQNFLALQNQLEGTENRITVERMRFNEAARKYNTMRRGFPNSLIAALGGFGKKTYFQSEPAAEKAPVVKF